MKALAPALGQKETGLFELFQRSFDGFVVPAEFGGELVLSGHRTTPASAQDFAAENAR